MLKLKKTLENIFFSLCFHKGPQFQRRELLRWDEDPSPNDLNACKLLQDCTENLIAKMGVGDICFLS